jgi:hypothetical protein
MDIVFTNTFNTDLEYPEPASKNLPTWFVDTKSYISGEKKPNGNGATTGTIKRCMPVFDAITSGYIIKLPADVYVRPQNGDQRFEWPSLGLVTFHPIEQAPNHPNKKPHAYPKWMNPWGIQTPAGYSTLFVQPFHRESVFTILPGIVDTDTYTAPVNFPFVINDPNFEGLIPKGTPIAQIIPFKRQKWEMKIGSKEEFEKQKKVTDKINTKFFDKYKNMFWFKKEYK